MKTYKANNELNTILLNQGLIETTSERDKEKGKRSYKISKQSRKEIHFDYIQIRIFDGIYEQDSRIELTEFELKSIILYFKLNSSDFKELEPSGKFEFKNILERLKIIENEIEQLIKLELKKPRRTKLTRILETYKNIHLN